VTKKSKDSFMGWLGRQVGYVKRAVKMPVPAVPKTVYRKETVQEAKVDGKPDHLLRRTTVDEVIVDPQKRMGETPMPRKEDHGV
jgi:hypothetical protein